MAEPLSIGGQEPEDISLLLALKDGPKTQSIQFPGNLILQIK